MAAAASRGDVGLLPTRSQCRRTRDLLNERQITGSRCPGQSMGAGPLASMRRGSSFPTKQSHNERFGTPGESRNARRQVHSRLVQQLRTDTIELRVPGYGQGAPKLKLHISRDRSSRPKPTDSCAQRFVILFLARAWLGSPQASAVIFPASNRRRCSSRHLRAATGPAWRRHRRHPIVESVGWRHRPCLARRAAHRCKRARAPFCMPRAAPGTWPLRPHRTNRPSMPQHSTLGSDIASFQTLQRCKER